MSRVNLDNSIKFLTCTTIIPRMLYAKVGILLI